MKQYTNLFQREAWDGFSTKPKPVKKKTDLDLLELVCQLHSRALQYPSEGMHNAYLEARTEMESRLKKGTTVSSTEVSPENMPPSALVPRQTTHPSTTVKEPKWSVQFNSEEEMNEWLRYEYNRKSGPVKEEDIRKEAEDEYPIINENIERHGRCENVDINEDKREAYIKGRTAPVPSVQYNEDAS